MRSNKYFLKVKIPCYHPCTPLPFSVSSQKQLSF